jgi:phosphate transport system substrate-binding protein
MAFRRTPRLLVPLLVVALLAGACGGGGGSEDAAQLPATTLNASGSTFAQGFYEEVIGAYADVEPDVTVNYAGGGSGKGRQELQDGVVDWAGSDGLIKDEDKAKYKGDVLYFPTVAAPITVSYNLADVKGLKLDADTIAKIFQRQIKTWDDPAVKALNGSAELPSTPITVVHRSDGSGTTENFTKYLVAAAPSTWTLKSGSTVEWPADTQAGNGNAGVASAIKGTTGAIGYVDLSDANATELQVASIKNADGSFVAPTTDGTAAALANVTVNPDLSYDPLNAKGAKAYPISSPTWILVYKAQADRAKLDAFKSFARFALGDGQDLAKDVDYAPLPSSLRDKALAQLDQLTSP